MLGPQPMESWQKHDSTMITIPKEAGKLLI